MINGKRAEIIAENFLKENNFEIVNKNFWIYRFGEIDIIAKKNNIYYFIEVKSLKSNKNFDPSLHYNHTKKKKFHQLVNHYVNKNNIEEFLICLITISFNNGEFVVNFYENV